MQSEMIKNPVVDNNNDDDDKKLIMINIKSLKRKTPADVREVSASRTTTTTTRAQLRWRLLARALTRSPEPQDDDRGFENPMISVRRFTNFGLVNPVLIKNVLADQESTWYEYRATIDNKLYAIDIREINKNFTANELIGFNNTGNICVWPSEECLAHYLLANQEICRDKNILELGGGMSCLAGVFVAKYCSPCAVTLTDGNVTSVDNARCIVARNKMADFIECRVMQWERAAKAIRLDNANANHVHQKWTTDDCSNGEYLHTEGLYDVILSADCLFFDEARLDLVETIFGWLSETGVALIVAPRRGSTFQKFKDAAVERGFIARQKEFYDPLVWSRHMELVENSQEYCTDIHYPLLLELRKKNYLPG